MNLTEKTIFIPGATSGIGLALAGRLHRQGNTVIVGGRRVELLEQNAADHPGIDTVQIDTADAASITAAAASVLARHPELNVLVTMAGIMRVEDWSTPAGFLSSAEETVTTNLLGPIRLTNALIDHLVQQPDAVIVNVTSGLAFVPLVATPTYNATKAAIHSYTVAMREALKGRVEVIELAPPAVQTGLTPGQESRPGYQPLDEFADEVMALLSQVPTPPEILVERVRFLRLAEAEGRFDQTLTQLNEFAAKARGD